MFEIQPADAVTALDRDWQLVSGPAGAWGAPADIPTSTERLEARVPGTVAATLAAHGRWSLDAPTPLHDRDHWYLTRLTVAGRRILRLEGLATIAEVFLDGEMILASDTMFRAHEVEIDARPGAELAIVFRALTRYLDGVKPKRARWRSTLVPEQRLRAVRTTLLGHMPGWCPPVDAVGPWRPISLIDPACAPLVDARLTTDFDGLDGHLIARLTLRPGATPAEVRLFCADCETTLHRTPEGDFVGELPLAGIEPWWPHTHGRPTLHDVAAEIDGARLTLGRVGFRRLTLDRGADGRGFGLGVNGVPVFARGTVWSPLDIVGLSGERDAYAPELTRIRDAGLNMLRVPGIGVYETGAFHDLCDELGILVWQDLMFANFDYPAADPAFAAEVAREVEQVLGRLSASPSLAVICGGSEITQQAAMLGLPPAMWGNALFDGVLPEIAARLCPDVPWLRSTPDGGPMPFSTSVGVTHYFGVGAYRRPLEDARRAQVRFAAECLAFAHVPDDRAVERLAVPPVHHPKWKARVPRDNAAAWDFEDTRLHYEAELFRIDPHALRQEDPVTYLDHARATTAHVIETTFAEWRRPGSPTRGALVFLHKDPWLGAGWGLVDADGAPKSAFHALARAARPLALILADEGLDGLDVHVVNDGPTEIAARLELTALAGGTRPVVSGTREIRVPPHGALTIAATDLFGAFFDTTRAYRFGPAAHDMTHARLVGADGIVLAEAFHFPLGRAVKRRPCGLAARVEPVGEEWELVISTTAVATSVVIADEHFVPADDGFHMVAGERRVRLIRRADAPADARPEGRVRALEPREAVGYRAP